MWFKLNNKVSKKQKKKQRKNHVSVFPGLIFVKGSEEIRISEYEQYMQKSNAGKQNIDRIILIKNKLLLMEFDLHISIIEYKAFVTENKQKGKHKLLHIYWKNILNPVAMYPR